MFHESQLILFAIAYLIGSIPFGLILTRMAGMGDIRQVGSGNIGATNVLRAGGKKVALLTLLLDAGKGFAPVYFLAHDTDINSATFMGQDASGLMLLILASIGLAVIIGHCFPIWLKFKGGKGVATAFGVLLALSLPLGLACLAIWLVVFAATRYSSLSALIAMALMPGLAHMLKVAPQMENSFILALISLLIILRHRSNINNLLAGKEHKFGHKPQPTEEGDDGSSAA